LDFVQKGEFRTDAKVYRHNVWILKVSVISHKIVKDVGLIWKKD